MEACRSPQRIAHRSRQHDLADGRVKGPSLSKGRSHQGNVLSLVGAAGRFRISIRLARRSMWCMTAEVNPLLSTA